ncbi:glycoside hydrolase family 3 protein [Aureobasidium sp. EXF-10727]|nr:glycoside hydrolase family 3 protein [Aureobasidium sp. EXF-10727]
MQLTTFTLTLAVGGSLAQVSENQPPFPNVTYPDGISPNPNAVLGAQTNQTSPLRYPSPWGSGAGEWAEAYRKAIEIVEQLTLEEKALVGSKNNALVKLVAYLALAFVVNVFKTLPFVSLFPAGINVGATWDKRLAYERGRAMGLENRDKGVTVLLGPVAGTLGRSPTSGRAWEGFSPDPYLTGKLFADSIRGIQSTGVQACAKHYVAQEQEHFRQTPESRDYGFNITQPGSSNIDDQTLHELYVWPFADAVKAGVASVMCSYNLVNNSQACQNSYLLNHVLKSELGFQGYVMSDWQATASGVPAILAGLDMTMAGDIRFGDGLSYFGPNLTIAILNGTVPQWRLDDMVTRILAGWYLVGGDTEVAHPPNFQSWTSDTFGAVHAHVGSSWGTGLVNQHVDVRREHGRLIREIGAASTVLLKNTHGTLPLKNTARLTAVFGEDAGSNPNGPNGCRNHACDTGTLVVGWGSGQASSPYLITPDAAIQHEVVSRFGSYESITNNSAFTQISALARRVNDVAGVCIVFSNADSGEGFANVDGNYGDRNNLTLWQGADAVIANVSATCNNTILVIHSVGSVEIDQYKENPNITAILWAGLPGYAIADVLFGRVNPGAKLPFTMGRNRSDYGTDVLYKPNQEVPQYNFQEGVFVDYRGFDHRNITPVYEFGFGLSYTTFEYSDITVEKLDVADYAPTTGTSGPAPTHGVIDNDTSAHVFPENITRIPLFVYPWLNSTNLSTSYGAANYGDNSFIPTDALNGSSFTHPPSSGPNGGNQGLWDILYHVRVNVTNTGSMVGDEVPQLYVSLGGPYDPKIVLRGFERVRIDAGKTLEVTFPLARRDLANWDTGVQDWVVIMTADPYCEHLASPNGWVLALSVQLVLGILISYIPQHVKIVRHGTSAGLSPWWVLLGTISSIAALANILVLPTSQHDMACCREISGAACGAALLGVVQIGVQWACFMTIMVLFLVFFPRDAFANPPPEHLPPDTPRKRDAVIVGVTSLLSLLVVGLISTLFLFRLPSHLLSWANFLGILAAVLSSIQYIPQLYTTWKAKQVLSLSIASMLIQVPGAFVFAFSLWLRVGWEGWSTWFVYCVTGVLQGALLVMAIMFYQKEKKAESESQEPTETDPLLEPSRGST